MSRFAPVLIVLFALVACTPAPVFKPEPTSATVLPADAAAQPERYHDTRVVWGGEVLEVRNRADASEVVILAYPLDAGQRPQRGDASLGRFIALLPGYVESFDYPQGRFVTIAGTLEGSRDDRIGEQRYVYAQVKADALHLWPLDFDQRNWHIGIGVSGAIR